MDDLLDETLARSLDRLDAGESLLTCLDGLPNGHDLLPLLEIADAIRQGAHAEPDAGWLRHSRDRIWFLASSRRLRRSA